jgi:hypothetical protein
MATSSTSTPAGDGSPELVSWTNGSVTVKASDAMAINARHRKERAISQRRPKDGDISDDAAPGGWWSRTRTTTETKPEPGPEPEPAAAGSITNFGTFL